VRQSLRVAACYTALERSAFRRSCHDQCLQRPTVVAAVTIREPRPIRAAALCALFLVPFSAATTTCGPDLKGGCVATLRSSNIVQGGRPPISVSARAKDASISALMGRAGMRGQVEEGNPRNRNGVLWKGVGNYQTPPTVQGLVTMVVLLRPEPMGPHSQSVARSSLGNRYAFRNGSGVASPSSASASTQEPRGPWS